jgi:long-chain acyl-CoA synthetase
MASPLVQQIFVHGDSMRSFLVAVVVPNESALRAWAAGQQQQQLQDEPDPRSLAELCQLESVRRAILSSLSRIVSQSGRPAWEAPKVRHRTHAPPHTHTYHRTRAMTHAK